MLLRITIETFWRKLGEKILIGLIFAIFSKYKNVHKLAIFRLMMLINVKKLPAKFYYCTNNLNGSIFRNF